jgi:hypothetical protein
MSAGSATIELQQFRSISELDDYLRLSTVPYQLIGKEADAPREFFLLAVRQARAAVANIGILSFGVGVKPSWVAMGKNLLVGFNDRVVVFSLNGVTIKKDFSLLSLFWQFIIPEHANQVCVLCETAVTAITPDGLSLWRVDTDLITDYTIAGNVISLEFSDSPPQRIDLRSGIPNSKS